MSPLGGAHCQILAGSKVIGGTLFDLEQMKPVFTAPDKPATPLSSDQLYAATKQRQIAGQPLNKVQVDYLTTYEEWKKKSNFLESLLEFQLGSQQGGEIDTGQFKLMSDEDLQAVDVNTLSDEEAALFAAEIEKRANQ